MFINKLIYNKISFNSSFVITRFYTIKSKFSSDNFYLNFEQEPSIVVNQLRCCIEKERLERNLVDLSGLYILPLCIVRNDSSWGYRSLSKQLDLGSYSPEYIHWIIDRGFNELSIRYRTEIDLMVFIRFYYCSSNVDAPVVNPEDTCDSKVALEVLQKSKTKRLTNFIRILPKDLNIFDSLTESSVIEHSSHLISLETLDANIDSSKIYKAFSIVNFVGDCSVMRYNSDKALIYFRDYITTDSVVRAFWYPRLKDDEKSIIQISNWIVLDKVGGDIIGGEMESGVFPYISKIDSKLVLDPKKDRKYLAFDIETYKDRDTGRCIPYAVGIRHGGIMSYYNNKMVVKLWYLKDFEGSTPEEQAFNMLRTALIYLLQPKFIGWKVYAHNLSGFDGPILISFLCSWDKLKITPLYRGSVLYSIDFVLPTDELNKSSESVEVGSGNNRIHRGKTARIVFKDSMKMLPGSLLDLGQAFQCQTIKGDFPHDFVNYENLDYNGAPPSSFNSSENFNLRSRVLEYLANDVNLLYEILLKFDALITKDFYLDFNNYLTLPSLAMAVYRSSFLKDHVHIPVLKGVVESYIRSSYRGGSVEVFSPIVKDGYYYDVNSLYPLVMKRPMPVGDPVYVINPVLDDFYGFCEAEVDVPAHLDVPFLSYKTKEGKIIRPVGKWTAVFYSESLKLAVQIGCKVKTLSGYRFEKGYDVFTDYVDYFYEKKQNTSGANRYIYKLFLNSLYGRFGMSHYETESALINESDFSKILNIYEVKSVHFLDPTDVMCSKSNILVEYDKRPDIDICKNPNQFFQALSKVDKEWKRRQVSVSIAAAITAEASIYMYKYQVLPNNKCFYHDTDSVVLQHPLDITEINNELGGMKLECRVLYGLFVNLKVYYIETPEGEIIKKFKGIPNNIVVKDDYIKLYKGEYVFYEVDRFYRKMESGVHIKKIKIRISPWLNDKRIKILDINGNWIGTKPINLSDTLSHPNIMGDNDTYKEDSMHNIVKGTDNNVLKDTAVSTEANNNHRDAVVSTVANEGIKTYTKKEDNAKNIRLVKEIKTIDRLKTKYYKKFNTLETIYKKLLIKLNSNESTKHIDDKNNIDMNENGDKNLVNERKTHFDNYTKKKLKNIKLT